MQRRFQFPGFRCVNYCLLAGWISIAYLCPPASAGQSQYIRQHYTKYEYRIPMRDGIKLFTAVYVPKDKSQKYPVILTRTPYSAAPYGLDNYIDDPGKSEDTLFPRGVHRRLPGCSWTLYVGRGLRQRPALPSIQKERP